MECGLTRESIGRPWRVFRQRCLSARGITPLIGLAAATALFWLVSIPLWLLWRRIVGAVQSPLSAVELLLTVVAATGLALAVAQLLATVLEDLRAGLVRIVPLVAAAAIVVLAAALSLPGTSALGLVWVWSVTLAAAGWLSYRVVFPVDARPDARPRPALDGDTTESLADDVEQRLTRGRDETGRPFVHGLARVALAAGQRTAHLHIAICPPLDEAPQVQVQQVAGSSVEARVGQSLPQGVRFDVRRSGSLANEQSIVLEFYAQ
jgi:hypothetical protein